MSERSDHGLPSTGARSHLPSPGQDLPYRLDRRRFLSLTGAAAAAAATAACASETTGPQAKQTAGGGPQVVFTPPTRKLSGSLSILLWSHFVPRHDTWFKGFVQDWGKRVGVSVRVDHIATTQVVPRIAAEIQAKKGHDLVQHIATVSQFEQSMLDVSDLVQEANRRWGKQLELCRKSSFNPNTNKFYAFAAGWSPDPSNYRKSLWQAVGLPNGPSSYDELLRGSAEIKKSKGVQLGLGLSQEIDSNMATRALMWSHGASIQDENEKVVINSDETVAAIEFMTRLFKESMTNEVFSWKPESNNQGIVAGKMSYILNSISAFRTAATANPKVSDDIFFVPALRGPKAALAAQHVMYNWGIPEHAANPDAAKEFMLHYTANFPAVTYHSELYDLPGWPSLVPQLNGWLDNDPFGATPKNKLSLLKDAVNWSTNIGYPGPANPAEGQIMSEFQIPNMFARAARGEVSPKQAAADAEKEINGIFDSWRRRGLIGG
jgi:ABC-type glycerol-3-phosphate transport system substrate-binding protein